MAERGRRRRDAGPRVEVRRLAGGRALRIDGTFASWYRPGRLLTDSVWDALAAPLAWLPPARRRAVLVLGLGGGSAARIARALAPRARIVGVELDAEVVAAAREAFDLDALGLEVVVGDALRYLARARGRFDLVVDDVFIGRGRGAYKPAWLPEPGLVQAARRLAPGGLLVSNALDEAAEVGRALARRFPAVVATDVADYDNRVFVAGPQGLSGAGLRRAIAAEPRVAPALARLRFRRLSARPGTRSPSR